MILIKVIPMCRDASQATQKPGITWICKKGGYLSDIKSEIYNSVKHGLKGMRHRNAKINVARK